MFGYWGGIKGFKISLLLYEVISKYLYTLSTLCHNNILVCQSKSVYSLWNAFFLTFENFIIVNHSLSEQWFVQSKIDACLKGGLQIDERNSYKALVNRQGYSNPNSEMKIRINCLPVCVSPHLGRVAVLGGGGGGGEGGGEAVPHLHLLLHTQGGQRGRLSE